MTYYDDEQIRSLRAAYDLQFEDLKSELYKVVEVGEVLYNDHKAATGIQDYDDVARQYLDRDKAPRRGWFRQNVEEEVEEEQPKLWNEVVFIPPRSSEAEDLNKTNIHIVEELRKRIINIRKRMATIFKNQHPVERTLTENRLNFLEQKFEEFEAGVNPYHILPGVLLEVDITSVKRKKTTMMAMANVLNEVLYSVSRGFHDAAFADFSRRRSTVRSDLDQSFDQRAE